MQKDFSFIIPLSHATREASVSVRVDVRRGVVVVRRVDRLSLSSDLLLLVTAWGGLVKQSLNGSSGGCDCCLPGSRMRGRGKAAALFRPSGVRQRVARYQRTAERLHHTALLLTLDLLRRQDVVEFRQAVGGVSCCQCLGSVGGHCPQTAERLVASEARRALKNLALDDSQEEFTSRGFVRLAPLVVVPFADFSSRQSFRRTLPLISQRCDSANVQIFFFL